MRDAFGGVFTMNFLLVFIFIYVALTAVSLNYAKAFKVKNAVIDVIEQQEVTDLDKYLGIGSYFGSGVEALDILNQELDKLSYYKTCDQIGYTEGINVRSDNRVVQNFQNLFREDEYCYRGVVILENRREEVAGTDSEIVYYTVETYANWNLGALNKLLALAGRSQNSESVLNGLWKISGEAKVVVKK